MRVTIPRHREKSITFWSRASRGRRALVSTRCLLIDEDALPDLIRGKVIASAVDKTSPAGSVAQSG